MKAMKAMKKKTVSKIASGRRAKVVVFHGNKEKTLSGLTASDLIKNKAGRIVSKKKSALAKKNGFLKPWNTAVKKARATLKLTGFVAIKKGTPLYEKAREFYNA